MGNVEDESQVDRMTQLEELQFQTNIRSSNMVRAAESLLKLIAEIKQFLILNDFPSVNEAILHRSIVSQFGYYFVSFSSKSQSIATWISSLLVSKESSWWHFRTFRIQIYRDSSVLYVYFCNVAISFNSNKCSPVRKRTKKIKLWANWNNYLNQFYFNKIWRKVDFYIRFKTTQSFSTVKKIYISFLQYTVLDNINIARHW